MTIRALAFDAFGTLAKIGERQWPYRQLMQWMFDQGRAPRSSDATSIMTRNVSLGGMAAEFGMSPPKDALASWENQLDAELRSVHLFPDTLGILMQLHQAGYRIGLCSNLAAPYGGLIRALLPALDAYALSFEVGAVKPDPAIYRQVLLQLAHVIALP